MAGTTSLSIKAMNDKDWISVDRGSCRTSGDWMAPGKLYNGQAQSG